MSANHKIQIFLIAAFAAALGIGIWYFLVCRNSVREVDLTKVDRSQDGVSESDTRSILRVAVGAMISPEITKHYYEDLLKLIGDKADRRTVLVQRKTYAEINALIESKEVDLAFICSGPYISGHDRFGLELLAVPVVDGAKVYYSYILAGADSNIKTFEDLKGKRFAFTDPDSNTGCLVPKHMIAERGETPESFFKESFFTYSHDNSIKAVSDKQADGAAVDSLIWDFLQATDPDAVKKTVVIRKSPPYGIPPLVVHPSLDVSLKAELKKILLSLHEDSLGKALLNKVRIERFEEGDDALYDTVREMQSWKREPQ